MFAERNRNREKLRELSGGSPLHWVSTRSVWIQRKMLAYLAGWHWRSTRSVLIIRGLHAHGIKRGDRLCGWITVYVWKMSRFISPSCVFQVLLTMRCLSNMFFGSCDRVWLVRWAQQHLWHMVYVNLRGWCQREYNFHCWWYSTNPDSSSTSHKIMSNKWLMTI